MKFQRIQPGEYRAEIDRPSGVSHIWVVRNPDGKWVWLLGGYDTYPNWEFANGPFRTRRDAIADVKSEIASLSLGTRI
jgi:hypothetical protein